MLAKELTAGGTAFVVIDSDPARVRQARDMGYLSLAGDATDEEVLKTAGIARARTLATVLPNDAANVFITLSARSLNQRVSIIARGEMPATEGKLRQAGADHVVLPAHIGAERVAEVILFPETARLLKESEVMQTLERLLRRLGLEPEVVAVPENGAMTGLTVAEIEARGQGRFLVVQIIRHGGEALSRPGPDLRVQAGDGVVIVGRGVAAVHSLFGAPRAAPLTDRPVVPG